MKSRNISKKKWYKRLSMKQRDRCYRLYTNLFDYKSLLPTIPDVLNNKQIPTHIARSLVRKIEKLGRVEAALNNSYIINNTNNYVSGSGGGSGGDQYESIAEEIIQIYGQYTNLPVVKEASNIDVKDNFIKDAVVRIITMKHGNSHSVNNNNSDSDSDGESLSDKLNKRIEQSLYNNNIKQQLKDKVPHIQNESNSDKYYQWLNIILTIPLSSMMLSSKFTSVDNMIISVMNKLNNTIYGMVTVKEELICTLASMFLNPIGTKGKSVGLCGPPGVGKTAILRSISSSLGIPFFQINIGNLSDVSTLDGHSFTYTKSEPGLIVKALRDMKCNDGIVFFDEIDKITESNKGSDIMSSLIHITDFTQNMYYQDNYVGDIPIDLSNIFFVFSMNDKSRVNKTLLSRIPVIDIPGYTDKEKEKILVDHLLPDVCANYNIPITDISIDDGGVKLLLSYNKSYSGVRELKELLEMLIKRVSLYYHVIDTNSLNMTFKIDNFSRPFTLTSEVIKSLINNLVSTKQIKIDKEILASMYT